MAKGILMSKEGQHGVILTKDGAFQKIRLPYQLVEVGQEIEADNRSFSIPKPIITALAACLVLFALFGTFQWGSGQNKAVAAYISFDINPSFEAGVDQHLHVLELRPMNQDGTKVIQQIKNYKNMPLDQFTKKVSTVLDQEGYYKQNPNIVVSTTMTSKTQNSSTKRMSTQIIQAINQIKQSPDFTRHKGSLEVLSTSLQERQAASKVGLTAGKYSLYENVKKVSPEVTAATVKTMSVKDLLKKANELNKAKQTSQLKSAGGDTAGDSTQSSSSSQSDKSVKSDKSDKTTKQAPTTGQNKKTNNSSSNHSSSKDGKPTPTGHHLKRFNPDQQGNQASQTTQENGQLDNQINHPSAQNTSKSDHQPSKWSHDHFQNNTQKSAPYSDKGEKTNANLHSDKGQQTNAHSSSTSDQDQGSARYQKSDKKGNTHNAFAKAAQNWFQHLGFHH